MQLPALVHATQAGAGLNKDASMKSQSYQQIRRLLRALSPTFLIIASLAARETRAADCTIKVQLSMPPMPLYSGDRIKVSLPPVPNHITQVKVTVGLQQMTPPDIGRIGPDGSLNLTVGSDAHSDVILDSEAEDLQYITVTVQDDQGNCGTTFGRAKIRTTDSAAIVIGVDKTTATAKELKYAQADALSIIKHLVDGLNLKAKNIWFLTQDAAHSAPPYEVNLRELADPDSISTAITDAATRTDRKTKLYFYFSGHQYVRPKDNDLDQKPNYYFVLPNSIATAQHLSSMYSWNSLAQDLGQIDQRVIIVIIDSCYSGNVSAGYSTDPSSSGDTGTSKQMGPSLAALPPKMKLNTNALLTSSSEDEPSWEFKKLGHGVFTSFLVKVGANAHEKGPDLTLNQMFYEAHIEGVAGDGVYGMTKLYDPGDPNIHYKQTPYADIDSTAVQTLWAHYKKN